MHNRDFLDKHYSKILSSNREKIINGGVCDVFLSNAQNDKRMSLVLLIRISPEVSKNIINTIDELKIIEPNMYFYLAQDFHITVMDILKGAQNQILPDNLDEYIKCINECVKQIKPFNIEFNGLTASDNAILVKGYYENDLQRLRELLRISLKKNNLKLQERYKTVSSHITIARIKQRLCNPMQLLSYIEKEHYCGNMKVEEIELSFHNWYDTKKELLCKMFI